MFASHHFSHHFTVSMLSLPRRCYFFIASVLVALAVSRAAEADELRFDQIQQRFIHNAYGADRDGSVIGGHWVATGGRKDEQLLDQLIYHRIRAIELDLHPDFPCGGGLTSDAEWFIYHDCFDLVSNVSRLSEALHYLRAFHDAQPMHEVVTIDLELGSSRPGKGSVSEFSPRACAAGDSACPRTPESLDALIRREMGDALYTPRDLLALSGQGTESGSLHRAVTPTSAGGPSGWPTVDALRGKFIFLLHGDDADLDLYFGPNLATINQRVGFLLDEGHWRRTPATSLGDDHPHVIFHGQLPFDASVTRLRAELPGHILRSVQIDDGNEGQVSEAQYRANMEAAQRLGIHFIFMDLVHEPDHPFVRTHNALLYPFGANLAKADGTFPVGAEAWQHASVADRVEPGSMLVIGDKSGGDLDGSSDRFVLAFDPRDDAGAVAEVWTAEIASTSNDSVHPHGKGFIMARGSTDADAPYCAVGRTADRYGLRLQGRFHRGEGTVTHEFRPGDVYRENYHFVRLEVIPQGDGSTLCRAYGAASAHDATWEQIGPDLYTEGRLALRGIATASNSGYNADNVRSYAAGTYNRFAFVDLRRGSDDGVLARVALGSLQPTCIGITDVPYVLRLEGGPRVAPRGSYRYGDTLTVDFSELPGNAHDWITLVAEGSTAWGEWKYTGGAVSGSLELMAPPAGRYRLRAYRDDSLTLIAESDAFDVAPSRATLAPVRASAAVGETLGVLFSDLPGNASDWIAIIPDGGAFGAELPWHYTAGAVSGSMDFIGLYPPGRYRFQAFIKDTQRLLVQSAVFEIVPSPAVLSPQQSTVSPGEPISVSFSNFPGNALDWVALVPNCGSFAEGAAWHYTGGTASGHLRFEGPFAPGEYCFQGFANDQFVLLTQSTVVEVTP